jgi:hypothetical protein
MIAQFQVQNAGLQGANWKTVCRAEEGRAREVFWRQVRYHSIGRFRLLGPDGRVVEERAARRLFGSDSALDRAQAGASNPRPHLPTR